MARTPKQGSKGSKVEQPELPPPPPETLEPEELEEAPVPETLDEEAEPDDVPTEPARPVADTRFGERAPAGSFPKDGEPIGSFDFSSESHTPDIVGSVLSEAVDPSPIREPVAVGGDESAVELWRVVEPKRISYGGAVTILRAGKVVDARSYDIEALRTQGVVLEKV